MFTIVSLYIAGLTASLLSFRSKYITVLRYALYYAFVAALAWQYTTNLLSIVILLALPALIFQANKSGSSSSLLCFILIAAGPLLLVAHPLFALEKPIIFGPAALYEGGKEFALGISYAKIAIVLALLCPIPLINLIKVNYPQLALAGITALSLVLITAFLFKFEMKFPSITLAFILVNLLVTVLAEEIYFRLILQEGMQRYIKSRYSKWITALVVGYVFFMVHGFLIPNGALSAVYLVAAMLYSFTYAKYQNIVTNIALHFILNLLHFIFLPYPL